MDYLTMDENVCPVCGKVFYTAMGRDWGWSYKGNHYCSYHCLRHVEVRHRVRQGWATRNWQRPTYPVGERAASIAQDMRAMRHVAKAANHLSRAAKEQTGEMGKVLYTLQTQTAKAADAMWATHQEAVEQLDEGKRHLVEDLFRNAKPLWQVAAERQIDTDLMGVKLCVAYEAMARSEQ